MSKVQTLERIQSFNRELDRFMQARANKAMSLEQLADLASEIAGTNLDVARASFWLLSDDKSKMVCISLFEKDTQTHYRGMELLAADYPAYFEAFHTARFIDANDARTDPRTNEFKDGYLTPLNIYSMLDSQIASVNDVQGVICCESVGEQRHWTADEIAFSASLADCFGFSVELDRRDKLNDELVVRNKQLEEMSRLADSARLAAEKANALKSEFLANTTHELKTPLNNILSSLHILSSTHTNETQDKWLKFAKKSGAYLLRSFGDILDMAQLESGIIKVNIADSNMVETVQEAIVICSEGSAPELVTLSIAPGLPHNLSTDQYRVQQIVVNLVSNALKYGNNSPVSVKLLPAENENMALRIEVSDQGQGIDPSQHEEIFNRFYQIDGQSNREKGGTGLGLSITARLTEALSGTIRVISALGKGASFIVELPNLQDQPETVAAQ